MRTKKVAVLSSLVLSASLVVSPFVSAAGLDKNLQAATDQVQPTSQEQTAAPSDEEATVAPSDETVKDDVEEEEKGKKHHGKKKGLERAIEHVKGTPAEQKIQMLLDSKYSLENLSSLISDLSNEDETKATSSTTTSVDQTSSTSADPTTTDTTGTATTSTDQTTTISTDQKLSKQDMKLLAKELRKQFKEQQQTMKEQLKQAKEQSEEAYDQERDKYKQMLEDLATLQEQTDDVKGAFELQTEAVKANLLDKRSYKKLAKLYEQINQYQGVKAFVNGEVPAFDVPPVIKEGRTLVPFRAISNALKAEVKWNQAEKAVYVTRDGLEIKLVLGESTAFVNGQAVPLDVPASTISDRTFVPLRFISEIFGAKVDWDGATDTAIIVEQSPPANTAAPAPTSTTTTSTTDAATTAPAK